MLCDGEQKIAELGDELGIATNELARVEQETEQTQQQILAVKEWLVQLDQQIAELTRRIELAGCG